MKRFLVTGATGFVGSSVCRRLLAEGVAVFGTVRDGREAILPEEVQPVLVQDLEGESWMAVLGKIETVVHLAARVHVMHDTSDDPLAEFRKVNVAWTERLAREAARAGARRFVYVSSIKVNGEESAAPYSDADNPAPIDPYGISKWEAETALRRIESETGLEVVVVRPTLVYGPGVKANFLNMMKVVQSGIPLPLASVQNRRSLIYVGNLVDALASCAVHPEAAGKTYLVSDCDDVTTPELISRVAKALDKPARLFPFPPAIMRLAGAITGKGAVVDRLLGSLTVDSSRIRNELGWWPPFTMEEGLRETAKWFRKANLSSKF